MAGIFSWFEALNNAKKKYNEDFWNWQSKNQILNDVNNVISKKNTVNKTDSIIAWSAELLQKINPSAKKMIKKYKNNKSFWDKLNK